MTRSPLEQSGSREGCAPAPTSGSASPGSSVPPCRPDQRRPDELRPLRVMPGYLLHPAGSVLLQAGRTRLVCSVSEVHGVPRWMREQSVPGGWVTAEYAMLPGATTDRSEREGRRGGPGGRSQEIQRLVGRSLRAVTDLAKLGQRTLYVDCDVLDADGGTRCAAITGSAIALHLALRKLFLAGSLSTWPLRQLVAGISVGIVNGQPLLDLCYEEDAAAEVDMNVVMTADGRFVEVQGTAEGEPFTGEHLEAMLALARRGLTETLAMQRQIIRQADPSTPRAGGGPRAEEAGHE